jgi:hypothetical protein
MNAQPTETPTPRSCVSEQGQTGLLWTVFEGAPFSSRRIASFSRREEAAEYMSLTTQLEEARRDSARFVELDALYKRFKATRDTAVWGGSFEREHAAAMDMKPIVNKMFDGLIKLLEARSLAALTERKEKVE